jgi:glycosyltransferase involved in cell wall biosynthesis
LSIVDEGGVLGRLFKGRRQDRNLLRSADAARDARRWAEAATAYAAVVAQHPDRCAAWVQLGNCAKEAGDYAQALNAYDMAIGLDDKNADTFLQKGHLLKLMGRLSDAAACYGRSAFIGGAGNPAVNELSALGLSNFDHRAYLPSGASDGPTIYLDVTDLLDYLGVNVSLSGIQRVVANLILNAEDVMRRPGAGAIVPVLPDYNGSQVFALGLPRLLDLIHMVAEGQPNRASLDASLGGIRQVKAVVTPVAGDTLLIPGAFWIYQRYDLLNSLRGRGVRVTVFIHDLIQVTHPEFVEPAATTVFRRSLADVVCVSSYLMTNSKFVADEVKYYLKQRMNFALPVTPITLATALVENSVDSVNAADVHPEYHDIAREEYVLCVGTIEVRKNHFYLIKLWERLIAEYPGAIPNLVFVGKWGWEIDDLRRHLAKSDDLGGRLFIFNGISDTDLSFLYKNCLFTIYPSFAEGWGLPVGESLGYGKPCVASKVTAIPEVGGELCRYIDPFDVDDGYRVVSEILADREGLAAWAATIRKEFKPKSWADFSLELFGVVESAARDPALAAPGNHCILEVGEIGSFGNDALALLDAKGLSLVSARMGRIFGWHSLEDWGCWASRRRAALRFGTRLPAGTEVTLYLHLKTPDGDECADCSVRVGEDTTVFAGLGPVPQWVTAPGKIGDGGYLDIVLISGKGFSLNSNRGLYIGILGLAFAPTDDLEARLRTMANIVPGGLPAQRVVAASSS